MHPTALWAVSELLLATDKFDTRRTQTPVLLVRARQLQASETPPRSPYVCTELRAHQATLACAFRRAMELVTF